jgi:hypothetical protein
MYLIARPHLSDIHNHGAAIAVSSRRPRRGFDKRRYRRALMSVMRRGALLVSLALLALVFLAARGSPAAP